MSGLEDNIEKLQSTYKSAGLTDKEKLYEELLLRYKESEQRVKELELQLKNKSSELPSKEEVETVSTMLDLISKLDDSTIEKLSKFGEKKE